MHHMFEATLYSTFPQAKGIHLTAPAYQIQPTTETANLRLLWRPSLNAHLSFDVSYVTGLVQRYLHSPTSSLLCSCLDVLRLRSASGTSNTALQVLTLVNVKDVSNKMGIAGKDIRHVAPSNTFLWRNPCYSASYVGSQ